MKEKLEKKQEFDNKKSKEILNKLIRIHKIFPFDNHIKGLIGEIKTCEILTKILSKNYKIYHFSANNSGYDLEIYNSNIKNKKPVRINVKTSYRFNSHGTRDKVYHWGCPTIRKDKDNNYNFDFIFLLVVEKQNLSDIGKDFWIFSYKDFNKIKDKIGTFGSGKTIWYMKNNWKKLYDKKDTKTYEACEEFSKPFYKNLIKNSYKYKGIKKIKNYLER